MPARSITAVLGPSGCGKTTLLRHHRRLRRPGRRQGAVRRQRRRRCWAGRAAAATRRRATSRRRARSSRTSTSPRTSPSGCRARAARRLPGRRAARAGRSRRPSCATGTRTSSPAASSSGWRSPGRWRRAPSSCCSTSRSRPSTPVCARARHAASSRALRAAGATAVLVTHDQGEALSLGRPGRGDARRAPRPGRRSGSALPLARDSASRPSSAAQCCCRPRCTATRPAARWASSRVAGPAPDGPVAGPGPPRAAARCGRERRRGRRGPGAGRRGQLLGHDAAVDLDLLLDGPRVVARVVGAAARRCPVTVGHGSRPLGPVTVYRRPGRRTESRPSPSAAAHQATARRCSTSRRTATGPRS